MRLTTTDFTSFMDDCIGKSISIWMAINLDNLKASVQAADRHNPELNPKLWNRFKVGLYPIAPGHPIGQSVMNCCEQTT